MHLFKSSRVPIPEMEEVLACMPSDISGLNSEATLRLWRQWQQQGSLMLNRIDAIAKDGSRQLRALGASLWLTHSGAEALMQKNAQPCAHRIYAAENDLQHWVMTANEIEQAHDSNTLNLVVLHFWSALDVASADFHPVFVQANSLFRDTHQGYGVQQLLQEIPASQVPILQTAGMQVVGGACEAVQRPHVLMRISAEDARINPGSTFSFLFFSPCRRLNLKPAIQRMLLMALRQMTDEEIAAELGCSRDYVRKLWSETYARMEDQGTLRHHEPDRLEPAADSVAPKRGRERRRLALEFLRANVQELRPGLPDRHLCNPC